MYKVILGFLFFAMSFTAAYGQYTYVPMPLSDGEWRYRMTAVFNYTNIDDYLLLGNGVDTMIGGNTYKKILRRQHNASGPPPFSFPTQSVVADQPDYTYVPMREDNKRVYMHYNGVDTLIYDFNRVVGDTLPTVFNVVPPISTVQYYRIVGIDTVNISGSLRKRFTAESITVLTNDTIRVIEGIGSDRGIFMNNISGNYGVYALTLEFHCMNAPGVFYSPQNGLCENIWPHGTPTSVGTTREEDGLLIYPNPFTEQIQIQTESAGLLTVMDMAGVLVMKKAIEKGHTVIRTTDLGAGMYLIELKGEDGDLLKRERFLKSR